LVILFVHKRFFAAPECPAAASGSGANADNKRGTAMTEKSASFLLPQRKINRRDALKGIGAGAAALALGPGYVRYAQAQSSEPIRIGFQAHRTGIGAAYGRWYERVTTAAAKAINDAGGINGRPIEIVTEDDGTDPKRGAEVVEKFVNQHRVDVV
jgi:branched-chain amino acid transport system substrate-binding protein